MCKGCSRTWCHSEKTDVVGALNSACFSPAEQVSVTELSNTINIKKKKKANLIILIFAIILVSLPNRRCFTFQYVLVIIQALIKICQLYPINIEWTCLHHFFINIQTSEATSTLIHTETFQGGIYISPNFHRSEKKNKTTTLEIRKNMIAFCPGLHLLYNQHNLQTAKKKKKEGIRTYPSSLLSEDNTHQ